MIKKSAFTIIACLLVFYAFAQNSNRPPRKETKGKGHVIRPNRCSALYLNTSTGVNNNTGYAGFSFDIPIEKYLSAELGSGISTWGYKFYAGGKYYLQPCQRGWAFGTGITYCTGLNGFRQNEGTAGGNEPVKLNLHSISNVLFAAYHYWSLGKRYNRIYGELGWSLPLTTNNYFDETAGDPLTSQSIKDVKKWSPGGPVAAIGVSFSVR